MKRLDLYIADFFVLAVGVYLHSPAVCLGGIALWGIVVAESILSQKNKDAEIVELRAEMAKLQKEHRTLAMDITNVQERAKTILGEVY